MFKKIGWFGILFLSSFSVFAETHFENRNIPEIGVQLMAPNDIKIQTKILGSEDKSFKAKFNLGEKNEIVVNSGYLDIHWNEKKPLNLQIISEEFLKGIAPSGTKLTVFPPFKHGYKFFFENEKNKSYGEIYIEEKARGAWIVSYISPYEDNSKYEDEIKKFQKSLIFIEKNKKKS